MAPQTALYVVQAIVVGALFALQTAANADLGRYVGGPVAATTISFIVGLVLLIAFNALYFKQIPTLANLHATPPHLLVLGGTVGAIILTSNVYLAPRLGAAATVCFFIAGQLAAALAIDQFGLLSIPAREATPGRIFGVALVFVGAVCVRWL